MGYPRLPPPYPFCQWGEGRGENSRPWECPVLQRDYIGEQCAVKWIHKRRNWCWPRSPSDRIAAERWYPNCISSQKKRSKNPRLLLKIPETGFPEHLTSKGKWILSDLRVLINTVFVILLLLLKKNGCRGGGRFPSMAHIFTPPL